MKNVRNPFLYTPSRILAFKNVCDAIQLNPVQSSRAVKSN